MPLLGTCDICGYLKGMQVGGWLNNKIVNRTYMWTYCLYVHNKNRYVSETSTIHFIVVFIFDYHSPWQLFLPCTTEAINENQQRNIIMVVVVEGE